MRVLVTEKLSDAGLELLRERFQVDVREDLARGDLAAEIAPYDALVIRSATRVTAEVLDAAPRLKVVARAGIGVDNVDVEAATRRGVMVVNAPQSNTISAAEHTMALLLAQARNVPQADRELHAGRWDKERWQGVELAGKTLGLIGLGRVGTLVASRAQGFGMRVIAFDPYVSGERAKELGVDVMPTLESLLVQADFVSIHLPGSPDTLGLIGEHQLAMMKHGARLVNTSRGGIVDEEALAKALEDGRLAGAALDVFAVEPATDSPLFGMEQVVVTPHLGASTVEAQDKAGTTVAEMVRLALEGQFVPYAVNVSAGAEVSEAVRPFVGLAERLGSLAAGLADGGVRSIVASYLGRVAEHDTRVLTLAILKGILGRSVNEPVSFVNAPLLARDRGLDGERDALHRVAGLREPDLPPRADRVRDRDRGGGHAARQEERGARDPGLGLRGRDRARAAHVVLRLRGPPRHHRQGRHDPRRARHQHRHDGGRSQSRRRRRVDGAHGRLARPARRPADGGGRDRRAHDPRRHAHDLTRRS